MTDLDSAHIIISASLRGGTGFFCAVVNTLLLAALYFRADKTNFIHRLLLYVCVSSLLLLLSSTSQAEAVGCTSAWHHTVCILVGFLNQLTTWVLILVLCWLGSALTLHYWRPNSKTVLSPNRRDVIIWLGIASFSLLIALIPLGTDGYGMDRAWCWLETSKIAERWVLWYGWVILCTLVVLGIILIGICCSERRMATFYESSRGIDVSKQLRNRAVARKIKLLIACAVVYLLYVSVLSALNQLPWINTHVALLSSMAILEPVSILLIPVGLVSLFHEEVRRKSFPEVMDGYYSANILGVGGGGLKKTTVTSLSDGSVSCSNDDSSFVATGCSSDDGKRAAVSCRSPLQDYSEEFSTSLLLTEVDSRSDC